MNGHIDEKNDSHELTTGEWVVCKDRQARWQCYRQKLPELHDTILHKTDRLCRVLNVKRKRHMFETWNNTSPPQNEGKSQQISENIQNNFLLTPVLF